MKTTLVWAASIATLGGSAVLGFDCWKNGPWQLCGDEPQTRICINQTTGEAIDCTDELSVLITVRFAKSAGPGEEGRVKSQLVDHGSIIRTNKGCPDPNQQEVMCDIRFSEVIPCIGSEPSGLNCTGPSTGEP